VHDEAEAARTRHDRPPRPAPLKAVRIASGRPLPPFGDPVAQARVLDVPLARAQELALERAGVELVSAAPAAEPYILFSDRTWFTPGAVRRLRAAGAGRLHVADTAWFELTGALQQLSPAGTYELALAPAGAPPELEPLAPVAVDLGLRDVKPPPVHPSFAHAARPLRLGAAMVHQLDHWSHILRVNHLALAVRAEELRERLVEGSWWHRGWFTARTLARSRSLRPERLQAALNERGRRVRIHPTAIVEFSALSDGVEIGPYSIVRASVLGPGAVVEDHATVQLSVVGEQARVGRYGLASFSVLYPESMISAGDGYQMCIFGRQAFAAWGATVLDLSFRRTIRVADDGEGWLDSGQHLLGAAIGHRARIGNGVRINYGASVANDALLVAGADDLLRDGRAIPPGVPHRVVGGRPVPVGR
jgi:hypothetical protein